MRKNILVLIVVCSLFLGLAAVGEGRLRYGRNLFGFIDIYGNEAIPLEFVYALCFSEGLAGVLNTAGLWGFIDRYGNEVVPFIYDEVQSFSEGLAWVRQGNR